MAKKIITIVVLLIIIAVSGIYYYTNFYINPFVNSIDIPYDSKVPSISQYILDDYDIDLDQVDTITNLSKKNMKEVGTHEVILSYKGKERTVVVNVVDLEAPKFIGLIDRETYIGDTVSYKSNVTVTDNADKKPEITIDSSKVNLSKAGKYPVTYTVTDASGNATSQTVNIVVKEKPKGYASEADLKEVVDKVLSEIIDDSMSDKEKLRAIYDRVRATVRYVDGHDKPGYVQAAYLGLTKHTGECYVNWAVSKALITAAGIKTYDIHNVPEVPGHYWLLVDIGEGWYHFDTTPRKGGFDGFYKTDANIKAYSDSHKNSHKYDPTLYPHIQ